MQNRFSATGVIILLFFIMGCEDDKEQAYSIEPTIKFENLEFVDHDSKPDELILTISFTDGDADLGLEENKLDSPYNRLNFFIYDHGLIKKVAPSPELIINTNVSYSAKLITARLNESLNLDNIPSFEYPWSCKSYEYTVVRSTSSNLFPKQENIEFDGTLYSSVDTFYVEHNENFYNIFIDFVVEQIDGTYTDFDFETIFPFPTCGESLNGRFPHVDQPVLFKDYFAGPFALKFLTKHSGQLVYTMRSNGFKALFSGKKIKLQVSIKDRALHSSNVIETPPLQL